MTSPDLFNVDAFDDVESAEIVIRDPQTGERTPFVIEMAGPEHPKRRQTMFARQRRLRAQVAKTNKMPVTDPEEDESEQTDDLVAWTLGWRGVNVEFSPDAARRLYTDPKRRWLREQLLTALAERERFIRRSVAA